MSINAAGHAGDLEALNDPVAQALLRSTIPSRLAYVGTDGLPRVVPVWSHWNGSQLIIGTFPSSGKVRALSEGDPVAISIDTDVFPYQALQLRGPVTLLRTSGLIPEYVLSAHRYLGAERARTFLERLHNKDMVRITVNVEYAHLLNMRRASTVELRSGGTDVATSQLLGPEEEDRRSPER